MSLTEKVVADQEAVAIAQAALDAATAQLAADQAALDALAPQVAAWQAVEDFANGNSFPDSVREPLLALVSNGRAALGL